MRDVSHGREANNMNSTAEGLRELHRLHRQLQQVEDELDSGPRRIAATERRLEEKQRQGDEQKQRIIELRKVADGKSLQLKSNDAKITDLKAKLNSASSNREYDVIRSQIEADEMANSVLEDEILEALEKVDAAGVVLNSLGRKSQAAADRMQDVSSAVRNAKAGLRQQAEELTVRIGQARKIIPEKMKVAYQRLVQAHGAEALAGVDQTACLACYAMVSPQERVQLNTGKVILCRNCGRIMYSAE